MVLARAVEDGVMRAHVREADRTAETGQRGADAVVAVRAGDVVVQRVGDRCTVCDEAW